MTETPKWWRRPIRKGHLGPDASAAQRILGLPEGIWDDACVAVLKGYYSTDVLTEDIAQRIGEAEATAAGLPPLWWEDRELSFGMYGDDVDAVRKLLGLPPGAFDEKTTNALKRYEQNNGRWPTGVVTQELALLLGEVE